MGTADAGDSRKLFEGTQTLAALRSFAGTPAGTVAMSLGLALLYFAIAKLGLRLALLHPSASPVWPPSGIAFAALLLFGYRFAPALLIAAFLANVTTWGNVATSLVIAAGNVAEGVLGAYLAQRLAGGIHAFERPTSIFRFVVFSALLATALSATIGVGILTLGGYAQQREFLRIWLTWWLGDSVGVLIVGPVIVLFLVGDPRPRANRWTAGKALEAAGLVVCIVLAGWLIFGALSLPAPSIHFLCIPLLLWAAFRFGRREAALAVFFLACAAVPATMAWSTRSSLSGAQANDMLLLLQGFLGVSSITTLAVAAVVSEHIRLAAELREARDELQGRIQVAGQALAGVAAEAHLTAGVLARAEQIARTGSFRWDVCSGSVTWSEELYRIFGRNKADFKGTADSFLSFLHPDDLLIVRAAVETAIRDEKGFRVTMKIPRPDGETRFLEAVGEAAVGTDGKVSELYGVCRDVTGERAESARFQSLLESAPDAMVVVGRDGAIVMVNAQTEKMTGYAREDLLGQRVDLLVPERFRPGHPAHRETFFQNPSARPMGVGLELFVLRRDGSELPVEISLSPLSTAEGTLVTAAIRDITARKEAEGSIRQLSRRLLQVQDEEQQRISRELQSGVIQTLDELRGQLSLVRESGTVFDWRTSDAIRRSLDLVREATKEARTLSYLLYPRLLEESGIVEAIRYYQAGFHERTGIKVVLDAPSNFMRLSQEAERSLFRVVQECLTNINRHAGATTAWITVRRDRTCVSLEVRDNGRGMQQVASASATAVGIRGLMERMNHLGGRLDVQSDAAGTSVTATIPVSAMG